MSQKPKLCKVKVYVYNQLYPFYQPAEELKSFFGFPTLSQAFQEFMDFTYENMVQDKDLIRFHYRFAKPFNLKVKCSTAKLWEGLSDKQKEHFLFWFNKALSIGLEKLFGGVWI